MSEHPLSIFLGLDAEEHDPRVLLDLRDGAHTRHEVLAALRSRLAQVASHPRAQSAEASEVRLLLHAAAARELARVRSSDAPSSAGPSRPSLAAISAHAPDRSTIEEFHGAALLTLGMLGGWNRSSLHRLKLLAISKGIPPEHVATTIVTLMQRPWAQARAAPRVTVHAGEQRTRSHVHAAARAGTDERELTLPASADTEPDPVRVWIRRSLIGAGLAVILLTAIGVAFFLSAQRRRASTTEPEARNESSLALDNQARQAGSDAARASSDGSTQPVAIPRRTHARLVASLRDAALQLGSAPEVALLNFEQDVDELSDRWADMSASEHAGAIDAVVEFVYRSVQQPESGRRAAEIVSRGAGSFAAGERSAAWDASRVRRAVWSAGMLTRMLREQDTTPVVRSVFESRMRDVLGTGLSPPQGGYEDGVGLALARLQEVMLSGEPSATVRQGAWDAYVQCATSGLARDRAGRERLLLALCERLMLGPLEPHEDAGVREGLRACVRGVEFSRAGQGRERILAWLGRTDLSIADMATVTTALIDGGRYKELDITMALSARASELDRIELLARYQSVWGAGSGATPRASVARWIDKARSELRDAAESSGRTPLDRLSSATRLATLNAGAARVFSGDASTLDDLLSTQQLGVAVMQSAGTEWDPTRRNAPSAWAARYWSVGFDIIKRRELLAQAPVSPNGAEASVLVRESMRGSPLGVRLEARKALSRVATDPSVLHALLDFAPFIPSTRENSDLLESALGVRLPAPNSPSWRIELRRALVMRMIERVGGGDSGFIDLAADHLARQYEAMASVLAPPARLPDTLDGPLQAASVLRAALTEQARRVVLTPSGISAPSQALSRLAESRRRAEGEVQQFVIEQRAVMELLAAIVSMERPEAQESIRRVLREWESASGRSWHVFMQIEASERAITSLWIIRMGGEP